MSLVGQADEVRVSETPEDHGQKRGRTTCQTAIFKLGCCVVGTQESVTLLILTIDHVLQSNSSSFCPFLPSFLFHLSYELEPEKAIDGAQEAGFPVSGGTSRQMINIRF